MFTSHLLFPKQSDQSSPKPLDWLQGNTGICNQFVAVALARFLITAGTDDRWWQGMDLMAEIIFCLEPDWQSCENNIWQMWMKSLRWASGAYVWTSCILGNCPLNINNFWEKVPENLNVNDIPSIDITIKSCKSYNTLGWVGLPRESPHPMDVRIKQVVTS